MRKHLKYDVVLMWPKSFAPKSCQGECMRGVVGEVEAALERIRCIGRIVEPREPERFRPSNSLASGGSAASGLPVPVNAQVGRSCSPPMIHSFGCAMTRKRTSSSHSTRLSRRMNARQA